MGMSSVGAVVLPCVLFYLLPSQILQIRAQTGDRQERISCEMAARKKSPPRSSGRTGGAISFG